MWSQARHQRPWGWLSQKRYREGNSTAGKEKLKLLLAQGQEREIQTQTGQEPLKWVAEPDTQQASAVAEMAPHTCLGSQRTTELLTFQSLLIPGRGSRNAHGVHPCCPYQTLTPMLCAQGLSPMHMPSHMREQTESDTNWVLRACFKGMVDPCRWTQALGL